MKPCWSGKIPDLEPLFACLVVIALGVLFYVMMVHR